MGRARRPESLVLVLVLEEGVRRLGTGWISANSSVVEKRALPRPLGAGRSSLGVSEL